MQLHLPDFWIIIGIVCIILEFFLPGAVIVFLGTSAIAIGLLLKIGLPTTGGIPFLVFILLSTAQILLLRRFVKSWFTGRTMSAGDAGLDDFIGKEASVVKGFEEGSLKGTVSFKGANWSAISSSPVKVGQDVIIEKQDGITLFVKAK